MSEVQQNEVMAILEKIQYPGYDANIVGFGIVGDVHVQANRITVNLKFNTLDVELKAKVREEVKRLLSKAYPDHRPMVMETLPTLDSPAAGKKANDPWAGRQPIPGVKSIIAVASGKGGVGKSTVSTNLALALAKEDLKVGLLDSDIYGPSIQIMMGIGQKPLVSEDQKLLPIEKFGVKMMSMGFILDKDTPVIWRGPMVNKAVEQFLRDVQWGELDVLVVDLPPGTGDVQLSLVQKTPLTGALIVTTPQEVALVDVRRGYQMFKKLNIHTFGVVENMSYYTNPENGEPVYIFGKGGGPKAATELQVPFLGEIPIDQHIAEAGDAGIPIVARNPDSESTRAFRLVAQKLIQEGLLDRVAR